MASTEELLQDAYDFLSGNRTPELVRIIDSVVYTDLDDLLCDIRKSLNEMRDGR